MDLKAIKELQVGQTIEFRIISDVQKRSSRKSLKGTICFKNDRYITLQLKHYKESFTYVDFRDRIVNVKLC